MLLVSYPVEVVVGQNRRRGNSLEVIIEIFVVVQKTAIENLSDFWKSLSPYFFVFLTVLSLLCPHSVYSNMLKRRKILALFKRSKSCPTITTIPSVTSPSLNSDLSFVNPYLLNPRCSPIETHDFPSRCAIGYETIPAWVFKTTESLLQDYAFEEPPPKKPKPTDHSKFTYDLVMNALVESLKIATTSPDFNRRSS